MEGKSRTWTDLIEKSPMSKANSPDSKALQGAIVDYFRNQTSPPARRKVEAELLAGSAIAYGVLQLPDGNTIEPTAETDLSRIPKGSHVGYGHILNENDARYIPLFTSWERLHAFNLEFSGVTVELRRALTNVLKGGFSGIVIDPGSEIPFKLDADEVKAILAADELPKPDVVSPGLRRVMADFCASETEAQLQEQLKVVMLTLMRSTLLVRAKKIDRRDHWPGPVVQSLKDEDFGKWYGVEMMISDGVETLQAFTGSDRMRGVDPQTTIQFPADTIVAVAEKRRLAVDPHHAGVLFEPDDIRDLMTRRWG